MKDINPSGSGELLPAPADRRLTAAQFQTLAEVSAAVGMRPISPAVAGACQYQYHSHIRSASFQTGRLAEV